MTLKVAVQMDPMHAIKIAGDSTFYLMLAAQKRGHELFHYLAPDLNYRDGCLTARAFPVTVAAIEGAHFSFGEPVKIDLGSDVVVVLMRQEPPFDLGYITATPLLERIHAATLVFNDPVSFCNAPETIFLLD